MDTILKRQFIVVSDLDTYYETLSRKISNNKNINIKLNINNLGILFKTLKLYEKTDYEYYRHILAFLESFEEGFVVRNAIIINEIINLTKEQRQIILLKFNDYNYSEDLKVINLVQEIEDSFEKEIIMYINTEIFKQYSNKEDAFNIALSLKNRNNKNLIGTVLDNILQIYPAINDIPIFSKLFLTLNNKIGDISYEYMKEEIARREYEKVEEYNKYLHDNKAYTITRKIKKEQIKNNRKLK